MASSRTETQLGWYLERIKQTPLLTAEQEKQLARRVREHSDPIAREQMISANLRLVVRIAKDYSNPGMTLADLVAEGNLGLLRAVEEFDPDAGVRFSTYAAWWIKQAIKRAMINAGQPIHIPAYLAKLINKWRRAAKAFENKHGRQPTTEELARKLNLGKKQTEILQQGLLAVNTPNQLGIEDAAAISEIVSDDDQARPEFAMLKAADSPFVHKLLERLQPRERKILELRFGLDGHDGPQRTYKEIGQMIGLTRERVRQLENEALLALRSVADKIR